MSTTVQYGLTLNMFRADHDSLGRNVGGYPVVDEFETVGYTRYEVLSRAKSVIEKMLLELEGDQSHD